MCLNAIIYENMPKCGNNKHVSETRNLGGRNQYLSQTQTQCHKLLKKLRNELKLKVET